ncbi:hypothetical protein [Vibrio phage vB_VcM_SY]
MITFKETKGFTSGEVVETYFGINDVIAYDVKVGLGEIITVDKKDVEPQSQS